VDAAAVAAAGAADRGAEVAGGNHR
jgi:hypothetical protein